MMNRDLIKMISRDSINNSKRRDSENKIKTKRDSTNKSKDLIKMTSRDSTNNNKRSTKKEPEDQEDIIDFSKY